MAATEPELLRSRPGRTLADRATASLREEILSGRLAPGTPLRLEELARRLEMSVMPVREAVRRLEATGLAEHEAHRGARVAATSLEDLEDTYRLRIQLEAEAIRLAAERFSADDEAVARTRLADQVRAAKAGDTPRARAAHQDFHFALYAASGSQWLPRTIRPLWDNCERYRTGLLPASGDVEHRAREHEEILDACVRRDSGEAVRLLRAHLALTANLVARALGGGDPFPDAGSAGAAGPDLIKYPITTEGGGSSTCS